MTLVLQPERSGTSSPAHRTGATCVLVLALMLAACSGGSKHSTTATTQPGAGRPKVLGIQTSVLKVGRVDVESAGPPNVQIDAPTGKAVLAAAQRYIDNAVF